MDDLKQLNEKIQLAFEKRVKFLEESEDEVIKGLIEQYKLALKHIKSELAEFQEKYPDYESAVAYKRLEYLKGRIAKSITELQKQEQKAFDNAVSTGVMNGYNSSSSIYEDSIGISLGTIDDRLIALNKYNDYAKITWLDAENESQRILLKRINSEITQGLIEGEGYGKIAQRLSKQFDTALYRMERIVRTEVHKASAIGDKLSFDDLFKQMNESEDSELIPIKVWLSVMDNRTRKNHREMNGKPQRKINGKYKFRFRTSSNNIIYVDAPGLTHTTDDIHCRCTTTVKFIKKQKR